MLNVQESVNVSVNFTKIDRVRQLFVDKFAASVISCTKRLLEPFLTILTDEGEAHENNF